MSGRGVGLISARAAEHERADLYATDTTVEIQLGGQRLCRVFMRRMCGRSAPASR
jgi:hypothetical protein